MHGQNLILNPSFEIKDSCVTRFNEDFYYPKYWQAPDNTSPDFINNCAKNSVAGGIPYTSYGYQYPRTGNSMVGIGGDIDVKTKTSNYIELIQGRLLKPLIVGHKYKLCCYYNTPFEKFLINGLSNNWSVSFQDTLSNYSEQFCDTTLLKADFIEDEVLTFDSSGWNKLDYFFTASKSSKYFIFGIIDTSKMNVLKLDTTNKNYFSFYLFFDDFSLVDLTEPQVYKPHISNVFTPNDDGKNDEYISYWELDPPEKFSMKIYNRWGAKLFDTNSIFTGWDGKYMGNEVPEGAYFAQIIYTLDGVEHKINQPLYLLR